MKPYYDVGGITIYHGDNTDVDVPPDTVDLLLTDPPYGIDWKAPRVKGMTFGALSGTAIVGDTTSPPVADLTTYRAVVFGANYYSDQLPLGQWIIWDKTGGGKIKGALNLGHAEMAWHNCGGTPVVVYHHTWLGYHRDSERSTEYHPTQKPVSLMRWIIDRYTEPGDHVYDPYMGSGPIARACADLGRRYTGVEIVEEYCETAVQRLAQTTLALT